MVAVSSIASQPGFAVRVVRCGGGHRGWSEPEERTAPELVLVRSGWFRRRTRAGVVEADPTVGYLTRPGDEETFAHPAGGDVCTAVRFAPSVWHQLFGELPPAASPVYVDAALELAHRRVVAAARQPDTVFALSERMLDLAQAAIGTGEAAGAPSDRHLVAEARLAIVEDQPAAATLLTLADSLRVSPFRLSRAFTREVGVPLTHYRNRVRVSRVLARLEAGEPDLARLAAELGFADQAHLTRTVRRHVGHTPTALRRFLRISTATVV